MTWSDSARDLRMENMMSCLRRDDTFSICKDSAKLSNSAGVLVFSSARCIVVSRSLSWLFSHGEIVPGWNGDTISLAEWRRDERPYEHMEPPHHSSGGVAAMGISRASG